MNTSTEFGIRLAQGTRTEKELDDWLVANDILFIRTGYEHRFDDNDMHLIGKSLTTNSMRFCPDRYLPEYDLFLEVISSNVIQKDKYDWIFGHVNRCYIVMPGLQCYDVQDLQFEIPSKKAHGIEVPIIEKYWRAPNLLEPELKKQYLEKIKANGKSASGETCGFIDKHRTMSLHISQLLIKEHETHTHILTIADHIQRISPMGRHDR